MASEIAVPWLPAAGATAAINVVRYFILSGGIFALIWFFSHRLTRFKIQSADPKRAQIWSDIKWSISTAVIQGVLTSLVILKGHSRIYYHISDYGVSWLFISVIPMFILLDAYFYFSHRLLHWKPLMKSIHITHHQAKIPTAFSTIAFHPAEAFLQWLIFPMIVYLIPVHYVVLGVFFGFTFLINNLGHLGYEFYPRGFVRHPIFRWSNTSTFHNMHHTHVNCNFGLYFIFLDHFFKTTHKDYENHYDRVKNQRASS